MSATHLALTFPLVPSLFPMNHDLSMSLRPREKSWFVGPVAEPAKGHVLWGAFRQNSKRKVRVCGELSKGCP
ncbi:hypothetical protein OKW34_003366 [Paraburkholderia youngii]